MQKPSDLPTSGVVAGMVAGLVLLVMQMVLATASGGSAIMPLAQAAGVLLGSEAMIGTSTATAALGFAVHLALSAVYGAIYAFIAQGLSASLTLGWVGRALLGGAFGAVVWVLNFQSLARTVFPWFLEVSLVLQLVLHVVAYGIPLGVLVGYARQRDAAATRVRVKA